MQNTTLKSRIGAPAQWAGVVVQRHALRATGALQRGQPRLRQQQLVAGATASQEAASSSGSSSTAPAAAVTAAEAGLLQRLVATCSLADGSTLLLAAVLGGATLLGAAEPAAAAAAGHAGSAGDAAALAALHPQLLGDLSEGGGDFWANVLRYVSYFFSVLLGTAYIAVKPLLELLKRPGTAVLVVAGLAGLVYFVSFTVQAMLGLNEPIDYTASSIVTPL